MMAWGGRPDNNDLESLKCCAPVSLVHQCSRDAIMKTEITSMIKMNCTFAQCNQSGYLHPQCFKELEDHLIRFIKSTPFSNNHKKETFRRYNFDMEHVRHFLWKEKGIYGLVYKQITCNCGKGFLKKDLNWPPSTYRRQRKINNNNNNNNDSQGAQLPKLQHSVANGIGKIRYIPSYVSDFPQLECDKEASTIPGATFANKTVIKQGEITEWDGRRGLIKNKKNYEERQCIFDFDAVQGRIENVEIGCEVEYQTVKRNKKMEAVSVKLVKSVNFTEGVITHWLPSHLSGVINTGSSEITVSRADFVPGGFVGDIIGKFVKFKMNADDESVSHVQVVDCLPSNKDNDLSDLSNVTFSLMEMIACPILSLANSNDIDINQVIADIPDDEFNKQVERIQPYLLRLAAHPTGYKIVVAFLTYCDDPTLEELLLKITDRYFDLTQTASGALCVVELLGVIPSDCFKIILDNYANISDGHTAFKHMIGDHSHLVFQSCSSLFGPEILRPWISCLTTFISPQSMTLLSGHKSMTSLLVQASKSDPQSMFLMALTMERLNCILDDSMEKIVTLLIETGGVKVCGVLLNCVSGQLHSLIKSIYGLKLLSNIIRNFSTLQLHIVVEELFFSPDNDVPLIVKLATGQDRTGVVLDSLLDRLDTETMTRVLDTIKDHLSEVVKTVSGKYWIKSLSQSVNCQQ